MDVSALSDPPHAAADALDGAASDGANDAAVRAPSEDGMTTAEYAIGTLAACGFAALLVTILRSGEVQGLLMGVIRHALALGG
jgi:uncharacterized protein DUF4244